MRNMNTILLIAFCVLAQPVKAQNAYYVLHVKGHVTLEKSKALLKPNDQVSDQDKILFGGPADAVAVISSKSGRMVLRPKPAAKSSELICVVTDILNPGTGRLSARAGGITNRVELNHFFSRDTLFLLGEGKVWISPAAFPVNSTNFFFIRYTWNGETINKKIVFHQDTMLLSRQEIYKVDGAQIAPKSVKNATLLYKQGSAMSEVSPFMVAFPEEASLREIVAAFKMRSTLTGNQFLDELTALLSDIYGRTNRENVHDWLKKNVGSY